MFLYYSFLASCVVLFVLPIYFAFHPMYKDGVFGRWSLLGISFFASCFLWQEWFGNGSDLLIWTEGLVISFATFFLWHFFRFSSRIAKLDPRYKAKTAVNRKGWL